MFARFLSKPDKKNFSKQQRRYENLLPFRRRGASVCFLQAPNFWNKWNWRPQIGESLHISLLRLGGVWVIEKRYQDTHSLTFLLVFCPGNVYYFWSYSVPWDPPYCLSFLCHNCFPDCYITPVLQADLCLTLHNFCCNYPITIHTCVSHSYKLSCVLPSLKFVLKTLFWITIASLPRLWHCVSLISCPLSYLP